MNIQEIRQTPIWALYEKGRSFHRRTGIYADTDRNYRMYNGDQWAGAKLGDVEPVQKNFIKPIVKYKLSVIHDNLYAIHYSPLQPDPQAQEVCDGLNRYAARVWEQDKLDFKGRRVTKDAAINGEGILYVDYDRDRGIPVNEIVKKNDVYYGNENDDDLQAQPYILIRRRMPVARAQELARSCGLARDKLDRLVGDNDTFDESGEAAKEELDSMVTLVYKLYRDKGTVRFSLASRWVDILQDRDTGLTLYPLAHFNWEEREGSARGEGEVRYLIPNQIEVNRTEVRRVLTVKYQAYPQKVVDTAKISNPEALSRVGGTIRTNGTPVEDVRKIVGTIPPAQMSPDVVKLQEDLIGVTRDLAGAGDSATGQINPETASGRAILAVQQASQAPMTEQRETYKNFLEDVARIWLEYLRVYGGPGAGAVPAAAVKIDVTPKGVYDRFAQEQTIENLLKNGFFSAQRVGELAAYAQVLDDDSVAPRAKILEVIDHIRGQQRRIAQIEAQAQMLQQNAKFAMQKGE